MTWIVERLRELVTPAVRVVVAAYGPDAPPSERVMDAWGVVFRNTAILRIVTLDPAPGVGAVVPLEERRAARPLQLDVQEQLRTTLPRALVVVVQLAAGDRDRLGEERQYAGDLLIDNGFLTAGELEAFPVDSLIAIALERYRRWKETGDPPG